MTRRYASFSGIARYLLLIGAAWLCAAAAGAVQGAAAQNRLAEPGALNLISAGSTYSLAGHLYLTEDPDKTINWPDMLSRFRSNLKGQKLESPVLRLPADGGAYWLEVTLVNKSEAPLWILRPGDIGEGRSGAISRLSILQADTARALADLVSPTLAIPVTLPRGDNVTLIMRIETDHGLPITLPFTLEPAQSAGTAFNYPLFLMIAACLGGAFFYLTIGLTGMQRGAYALAGYFTFLALFVFWQNQFALHNFALSGEILPILLTVALIFGVAGTAAFWQPPGEQGFVARLALAAVTGGSLICVFLYSFTQLTAGGTKTALILAPFALIAAAIALFGLRALRGGEAGSRTMGLAWLAFLAGMAAWLLSLYGIVPLGAAGAHLIWAAVAAQAAIMMAASLRRIHAAQADDRVEIEKMRRDEAAQARIRQSKEAADQARLLRVLEREREIMAELRERENIRTEEMRIAKEVADEANRAKSAFLAVVSHEIRTPMTGVMGMVRLLLDSNLTKDQRENVITMQESGDAMLALLNDILDFEKIEVGRVELESIPFDLPRLIQSIVTLMSGHAAQKKITLAAELDPNLPKQVVGDPTRLRQVLLNLTGNAIKFTQSGSVIIKIAAGAIDGDKKIALTFSVIDSGIGISEEAIKNLFSPFAQADSSITRKFGGTGLGLAISKGLISAMGSDIEVSSQIGKGSRFYFTLKLKVVEVAPLVQPVIAPAVEYKPVLPPCTALLVEDNEVNRKVIAGFLEREPVNLLQVGSADEVFEILNHQAFDVILMDVELPGMRGDEVTSALRLQGLKTPVVGLTGNVSNEDIRHYYSVGMDAVVGKPIDPDKLKTTILRVLEQPADTSGQPLSRAAAPAAQDATAPNSGMTDAGRPDSAAPNPAAPNTATPHAAASGGPAHDPASSDTHRNIPEAATATPDAGRTSALDLSVLQSLKDNLPAAQLNELMRGALDKAGEIIWELHGAANEENLTLLAAKGHELRGMAGNFGMTEMSRLAGIIEKQARGGVMDQSVSDAVTELPKAKARAEEALAVWLK